MLIFKAGKEELVKDPVVIDDHLLPNYVTAMGGTCLAL